MHGIATLIDCIGSRANRTVPVGPYSTIYRASHCAIFGTSTVPAPIADLKQKVYGSFFFCYRP